jgi:predicted nucleotidyltransferase
MRFHEPPQTLLDSKAKLKLLSYLFSQREVEMSERELARVLGLSNFSVNQLMKLFEQNNLVERRRLGATTVWRLKRGSYYFELLEPMLRRISTFPAPLEHLKNLVLRSYPLKQLSRIYLYGSIAEGRENYNSDIDLFVVVKSSADKEEIDRASDKLRASCLSFYGNVAQIVVMSESEYSRKRRAPLVRQVEKGLELYPEENLR